jgi:hypothetical protein
MAAECRKINEHVAGSIILGNHAECGRFALRAFRKSQQVGLALGRIHRGCRIIEVEDDRKVKYGKRPKGLTISNDARAFLENLPALPSSPGCQVASVARFLSAAKPLQDNLVYEELLCLDEDFARTRPRDGDDLEIYLDDCI